MKIYIVWKYVQHMSGGSCWWDKILIGVYDSFEKAEIAKVNNINDFRKRNVPYLTEGCDADWDITEEELQ